MATQTAEPTTTTDWQSEFLRKLNNRPKGEGNPLRTSGLLVTVHGASLARWRRRARASGGTAA